LTEKLLHPTNADAEFFGNQPRGYLMTSKTRQQVTDKASPVTPNQLLILFSRPFYHFPNAKVQRTGRESSTHTAKV